jgi:hypothetical protein
VPQHHRWLEGADTVEDVDIGAADTTSLYLDYDIMSTRLWGRYLLQHESFRFGKQ